MPCSTRPCCRSVGDRKFQWIRGSPHAARLHSGAASPERRAPPGRREPQVSYFGSAGDRQAEGLIHLGPQVVGVLWWRRRFRLRLLRERTSATDCSRCYEPHDTVMTYASYLLVARFRTIATADVPPEDQSAVRGPG